MAQTDGAVAGITSHKASFILLGRVFIIFVVILAVFVLGFIVADVGVLDIIRRGQHISTEGHGVLGSR